MIVIGEKARQQFHSTLAQTDREYIVSRRTSPIFSIKIPDTIICNGSPIGYVLSALNDVSAHMTLNFKVNKPLYQAKIKSFVTHRESLCVQSNDRRDRQYYRGRSYQIP